MKATRLVTSALLILTATFLCGCGSGKPTSTLISWTTGTTIPVIGGTMQATEGHVFLLIKVSGTGDKIYIFSPQKDQQEPAMYVLRSEDFVISTTDGKTFHGIGYREPSLKDFAAASYRDKPNRIEEVEVAIAVEKDFATRSDLVLRYHELPEIALTADKRQPDSASK